MRRSGSSKSKVMVSGSVAGVVESVGAGAVKAELDGVGCVASTRGGNEVDDAGTLTLRGPTCCGGGEGGSETSGSGVGTRSSMVARASASIGSTEVRSREASNKRGSISRRDESDEHEPGFAAGTWALTFAGDGGAAAAGGISDDGPARERTGRGAGDGDGWRNVSMLGCFMVEEEGRLRWENLQRQ